MTISLLPWSKSVLPGGDGVLRGNDRLGLTDGPPGELNIAGSGFGVGPTVVLFDRFNDQAIGETINTTADIGGWKVDGNAAFNLRPPIVGFGGRNALTHNDPAPGQGWTKYGLDAGPDQGIPHYTRYTEFYKLAVPAGKNFPGAGTPETFPSVSSMKVTWHQGHGLAGVDGTNDLVSLTHVGAGSFQGAGNNIEGQYWNGFGTAWKWDEWNSIVNIYSPDSPDIQGPSGSQNINAWNSAGKFSDINDPWACWKNNGGLPLPTPLRFDDIAVLAWSGNGTHTDSQLVMAQYYLSVGENHEKYLLLANNADLSLATNTDVVAADSWSDIYIQASLSDDEVADNTHYFVMSNQAILATGAI